MNTLTTRFKTTLILLAVMIVTLTAATSASAATLKLSASSVFKGETVQVKALYDGKDVSASSTWKTSKKAVATVSKKGVVKGVKAGTATITCKYKKKTAKIKIQVKAPTTSLYIKPSANVKVTATKSGNKTVNKTSLTVNEKGTLTPYLATKASKTTYKKLAVSKCKFTTSNKSIVTVAKNGTITAKKAGTATIKVTYSKKTWSVQVTVKKKAAHVHTWTTKKVVDHYEEEGYVAGIECADCGKIYADDVEWWDGCKVPAMNELKYLQDKYGEKKGIEEYEKRHPWGVYWVAKLDYHTIPVYKKIQVCSTCGATK